jgi:hypothetical protein
VAFSGRDPRSRACAKGADALATVSCYDIIPFVMQHPYVVHHFIPHAEHKADCAWAVTH